jgi:branched-chain amino acid transport system permease protein
MVLAPWIFNAPFEQSVLTQIAIAMVACLSYNMLWGQGGMLSFGHAVYTGLGAYMAMHVMQGLGSGGWGVPVSLIPLVGGVCGMGFAVVLGYVSTRKSGTTLAMITLGLGELVFAMSLMFSDFFGGEAGLSGNRVQGAALWGIDFKSPIQVYYLIGAYTWVSVALMYAFTQTPLGRLLNAARDNAERLSFIGYQPQRVRYLAFIISGFFAGVSGGMAVLHFEMVTADVVGTARSGAYLLFTILGGFIEPIAIMVMTLPIMFPVMKEAGFDPIWLGVVAVKLAEIGVLTPPVGLNVFVVKSSSPIPVTLGQAFAGVTPFILLDFLSLGLYVIFPEMILWLPNLTAP